MPGALDGLKVIDLTSHLSGPYCTMLLADHGADVIKVERPGTGDDARKMPPFQGGEGAPFMLWNRNKRGVTLDLKLEADKERFLALVDGADILVENFRPGTLDRLGIGYDVLRDRNPRLVYCAISGFGQTGPYREKGGFDLMTQAMSGLMAVCGPEDGPPHRLPIAISDVGAGMFAAFGILAAINARHRTGRGQFVETSLLEAAVSFGVYEAANFFATGKRPARLGQAHRGSAPYQVFRTRDGWLTVGASQQNFYEALCDLVGLPELKADPRFASNAARVANNGTLVAILQEKLEQRPSTEWQKALERLGIPVGPVLHHDEVFADPQILARDMAPAVEHPKAGQTQTLGVPVKLSETPGGVRRPAPLLGEHNDEIFG
jgi:crotonobetainyl-CoA:carnitine CoA-transferase CaiB-like acyl-CoA transferase